MKTKQTILRIVVFSFVTIVRIYSQGYLVPNGVTYAGYNPAVGYEIHVLQNPTNTDYTGFFLTPLGKTQPTVYSNTFLFYPLLDEGVRTFFVSSNQPISIGWVL